MKDTKLLSTCCKCGEHLTLMESVRVGDNQPCLVVRCLGCFQHPVEEVAELKS